MISIEFNLQARRFVYDPYVQSAKNVRINSSFGLFHVCKRGGRNDDVLL